MSLYSLPNFPKTKLFSKIKLNLLKPGSVRKRFLGTLILIIFFSCACGFLGGIISVGYFYPKLYSGPNSYVSLLSPNFLRPAKESTWQKPEQYFSGESQQEMVVRAVKEVSPAVVSIVICKDMPIFEEYYLNPFKEFEKFFGEPFGFEIPQYRQKGTEKKEIGGGTGFIVSEDGLILTNKHVVADEEADYTVLTNDGKRYEARVLARDPAQDLAVLKIKVADKLPVIKLGNSDDLEIGQTVIAIGNVLGEFRNSVSVGVISGLGRTVTASGGGYVETLEGIIQTDAAINKGNSGGPLLNLQGEVIGINTAMALGAENVGFAIPINRAKKDIEQVKKLGKIVYPFLGVYYTLITPELKEKFDLPVDYGAWIGRGASGRPTETAVFLGSPAAKAGLKRDDIVIEFNQEKITLENSLAKIIMRYSPGDKVSLKILRDGKEKKLELVLAEKSE